MVVMINTKGRRVSLSHCVGGRGTSWLPSLTRPRPTCTPRTGRVPGREAWTFRRTSKQRLAFSRGPCTDQGRDKRLTRARGVREDFLEEVLPELSLERWTGSWPEDKGRLHQEQPASLQGSFTARARGTGFGVGMKGLRGGRSAKQKQPRDLHGDPEEGIRPGPWYQGGLPCVYSGDLGNPVGKDR